MDKASDYETGDSRFESWQGRLFFFFYFYIYFFLLYFISYQKCMYHFSVPIIKPRATAMNVNEGNNVW